MLTINYNSELNYEINCIEIKLRQYHTIHTIYMRENIMVTSPIT